MMAADIRFRGFRGLLRRCAPLVLMSLLVTPHVAAQMATAERLEGKGWWPTKRVPRDGFAGPRQCAACHQRQATTQPTTSMARTGERARDSAILRAPEAL